MLPVGKRFPTKEKLTEHLDYVERNRTEREKAVRKLWDELKNAPCWKCEGRTEFWIGDNVCDKHTVKFSLRKFGLRCFFFFHDLEDIRYEPHPETSSSVVKISQCKRCGGIKAQT